MKEPAQQFSFEVEVRPGEQLTLPPRLVECVGAGHWMIHIQRLASPNDAFRDHAGFLKGYSAEDEGLYDDYSSR